MKHLSIIICSIVLLAGVANADPLWIQNSVVNDTFIPQEVKSVVMGEVDKHANGIDTFRVEVINARLFSLFNRSTYMIFSSEDEPQLLMLFQIVGGYTDLMWARYVGMNTAGTDNWQGQPVGQVQH